MKYRVIMTYTGKGEEVRQEGVDTPFQQDRAQQHQLLHTHMFWHVCARIFWRAVAAASLWYKQCLYSKLKDQSIFWDKPKWIISYYTVSKNFCHESRADWAREIIALYTIRTETTASMSRELVALVESSTSDCLQLNWTCESQWDSHMWVRVLTTSSL